MELTLTKYGTYLHVKNEMFEVITTNDKEEEVKELFAAKRVTSILIGRKMALSTEAMYLAIQNNIDIVLLERDGTPVARVWHGKLSSTTKVRKSQLEASLNVEGLRWTKIWLTQKIGQQLEHLKDLKKHRVKLCDYLDEKIKQIQHVIGSINLLEGSDTTSVADTLRGLEGTAGRLYFEALSKALPEEHQFKGRSFRPAQDSFNAFLNYAYGILYRRTEQVLTIAGIDPYVGFLHRDDYNQLSMVYDFIEPYRFIATRVVFTIFSGKKVGKKHVEAIANGCQLNKEGKVLLTEAFDKSFRTDKVVYKGKRQSYHNIMQLDAHAFAQALLNKN